MMRSMLLMLLGVLLGLQAEVSGQEAAGPLKKAVTFYASFDEAVRGDVGQGVRTLSTRFNHETEKGKFIFQEGFDEKVFRIAPGKGVHGGALEAVDVLPRNGRVFFPAKNNLAFRRGGWSGAMSMWIRSDLDKFLKTKFCDPVQITHKGSNNGGIWFDFNDAKPRDLRMGVFPGLAEGVVPIKEEDPQAPMVRVPRIGFREQDWHHIVLNWRNFDTGKKDAVAALWIDGKQIGDVKDRAIGMEWDIDRVGIYLAINYIGLLDEFALFDRGLSDAEIALLLQQPGVLASLKPAGSRPTTSADKLPSAEEVLQGLRQFYAQTAKPDGSFTPGIDPEYRGMSDSAYSDLAAVTYAVTLHKTFGWKLPFEDRTVTFLLDRQREDGNFFNVAGTVDPQSPEGKTYNTTQALVALKALGVKPRRNPLPVFEEILKEDYKTLPAYSTSFFPLAYLCYGQPIPQKADKGIRALMVQDETGYTNNHIAATFHASHYYHLVGEPTPKSHEMVNRILRDQKADGSWMLNLPSRDRHATYDAVFSLLHEGGEREDVKRAIARAAKWALSCRNADGGFGHYPGSTSDADAIYFQVGTLVLAGYLKPVDPLPADAHLLSWGHLMPVPKTGFGGEKFARRVGGWVGGVAFAPDSKMMGTGSADGTALLWELNYGNQVGKVEGHSDIVSAVGFSPDNLTFATASYDHTARLWHIGDKGRRETRVLRGHRGAVLGLAFSPDSRTVATGSVDGTIKLWDVASGALQKTLEGHRSWVNSVAYSADGKRLLSGSSDGTVRVWSTSTHAVEQVIEATKAEVRSVACSADGAWIAAGLRYGKVRVWNTRQWTEALSLDGHEGDVWSVAFTPDSSTLIAGSGDWNRPGQVKLWQVPSGKLTSTFQHTGEVLSVAVSPDGQTVAAGAGDKVVRVWALRK